MNRHHDGERRHRRKRQRRTVSGAKAKLYGFRLSNQSGGIVLPTTLAIGDCPREVRRASFIYQNGFVNDTV